jgi:hypothetical protein
MKGSLLVVFNLGFSSDKQRLEGDIHFRVWLGGRAGRAGRADGGAMESLSHKGWRVFGL